MQNNLISIEQWILVWSKLGLISYSWSIFFYYICRKSSWQQSLNALTKKRKTFLCFVTCEWDMVSNVRCTALTVHSLGALVQQLANPVAQSTQPLSPRQSEQRWQWQTVVQPLTDWHTANKPGPLEQSRSGRNSNSNINCPHQQLMLAQSTQPPSHANTEQGTHLQQWGITFFDWGKFYFACVSRIVAFGY